MKQILGRKPHLSLPALLVAAGLMFMLTSGRGFFTSMASSFHPATTLTVTTTDDSGTGSLREVIAAAMPGDTITFDTAGVFATPQTITLTTGQLEIHTSLTIQGTGASRLTVSGGGASRVFNIAPGNTVTLDGLTVSGGNVPGLFFRGGGISNVASTLTVNNCTVSGNSCFDGGGIYSINGTLTVSNSTISGNSARVGSGGGIRINNCAGVMISDSTFSGNSAKSFGGGIYIDQSTLTTVSTCTISGNSAGNTGGGVFSPLGLTLNSCTVTANRADTSESGFSQGGGGIYVLSATINNTIVAGNFRGTGSTADDISGSIASASHCLIGDATTSGGITDGVNGNIVGLGGSGTLDINTVLDTALADNGGPTKTHRLKPLSPAIDVGDDTVEAVPTTDQRGAGFPRLLDGNSDGVVHVDIGAVEFGVCPQPQGYWKNNPASWLVTSLTLGSQSYTQAELLTVLNTPVGSGKNADASLILAYQLIAAKLNVANGANPAPASATIAAADALLATFSGRLPYAVKPSSSAGQQMTSFAALLDQYNNRQLTTGCSP